MPSSFHSNDVCISDILTYISKGDVQLPDFQRRWVWDDNEGGSKREFLNTMQNI